MVQLKQSKIIDLVAIRARTWLLGMAFLLPILLSISLPTNTGHASTGEENEDKLVRAKIGIQLKSADNVRRAKGKDSLRKGDELQLHVYPAKDAYVYLVHTDKKAVRLLNADQLQVSSSGIVAPNSFQYFKVDGLANQEVITVVVSDDPLDNLGGINTTENYQYQTWVKLEKTLTEKGKIKLSKDIDKPFSIAGNVRGVKSDPFLKSLKVYSGKSVLVKKYEFQVKE